MLEFFEAVARHSLLQYALISGLLVSVACGVVGTYVVVRRISYIAGGIAHSVLGGMGAARYFQIVHGWEWLHPIYGAVLAALLSAFIIGAVSMRSNEREDTIIGAIWATGMAIGVLFIAKTPGYNQDLMSYLFGNILMVSKSDLWLIGGLDLVVIAVSVLFHNQLLAVCFDEEFSRLRGLNVEFFYLLLLCLTALTVVLLVTVVGLIMVIALLTLPIAVASHFTKRLWHMMLLGSILSAVLTTSGLALSYGPDWPAGATTILLAASLYLMVKVASRAIKFRSALG